MSSYFRLPVLLAFLFLVAGLPLHLPARDFTSLQGEFWVDFEPMGKDGPMVPPTRDEALKALLDEARTIFAAMIYGYEFTWRPADKVRQAEESFVIKPLGEVPWGDPGMEFRETRNDDTSLYLRVRYFTTDREQSRLEAWTSAPTRDAAGIGLGSYFEGVPGKLRAFSEACKDAIKAEARGQTHNRPSMIAGRFTLADMPRVMVISGCYQYIVKLKLQVSDIDSYRNY